MATHSSILAGRIPWTLGPGRLLSMGLQRVGHDWSDLASTHTTLCYDGRTGFFFWEVSTGRNSYIDSLSCLRNCSWGRPIFCLLEQVLCTFMPYTKHGPSQELHKLFCSEWIAKVWVTSVQFSHSVLSNSLQPHGLQHTRPPCPSPSPRVYSNSCP